MAESLDFNSLLEQAKKSGFAAAYKALFNMPAPGTRDAQDLDRARALDLAYYETRKALLDRQRELIENPSAQLDIIDKSQDAALKRQLAGMQATSQIGTGALAQRTGIETGAYQQRLGSQTQAATQLENTRAANDLAKVRAQFEGTGSIVDRLSAAQTGMFGQSLDARTQLANQLYGLERDNLSFKQDMARQMLAERKAANSGVRGFLGNILLPLVSAGAQVGALFV